MDFALGLQTTWDLHVYIHLPGDEIWTSFGSFPQEIAYFRLDVNNTDGMKSTDLALTENEVILLNKESAPCRSKLEQVKKISYQPNVVFKSGVSNFNCSRGQVGTQVL